MTHTFTTIPDDTRVPLRVAHLILGGNRSRATLYRWSTDSQLLPSEDGPDGVTVLAGDVRRAEQNAPRRGGHRTRRNSAKGEPNETE